MKPMGSAAQRWRLGLEPVLVAVDPATQRLLRYDTLEGGHPALEAQLWGERDLVSLRTDLCDCHIAICSLEVLVAFSDNFDYQVRGPRSPRSGSCACLAARLLPSSDIHVQRRE